MSTSDSLALDRIDALLRGSPPEGEREALLQGLVRELRADAPGAPGPLRVRVRALVEAPPRRRALVTRRRTVLVVASAVSAIVAAVGATGLLPRDDAPPEAEPSQAERALTRELSAESRARLRVPGAPALAQMSSATRLKASTTDQALGTSVRAQDVNMSIELRVSDADRLSGAVNEAMRATRALGGFVAGSDVDTQGKEGRAELALRVPVGQVEEAVVRLSRLGTITSQRVATEDLQADIDRRSRRISALRRAIRVDLIRLRSGTLDVEERLRTQLRLEDNRAELEQVRRARRGLVREAATAELSLTLHTREAAAVREDESGLAGAARDALDFLGRAGTVVLFAAIVLSPLLLLALLASLVLRSRSRRLEARLLESTRPGAPSPAGASLLSALAEEPARGETSRQCGSSSPSWESRSSSSSRRGRTLRSRSGTPCSAAGGPASSRR
jgi:Domain of unknown function (DUF4349)